MTARTRIDCTPEEREGVRQVLEDWLGLPRILCEDIPQQLRDGASRILGQLNNENALGGSETPTAEKIQSETHSVGELRFALIKEADRLTEDGQEQYGRGSTAGRVAGQRLCDKADGIRWASDEILRRMLR